MEISIIRIGMKKNGIKQNHHNLKLVLVQLISIIFIAIADFQNIIAQEEPNKSIKMITRPMPDSILLRWAPASFEVWQVANKVGYVIERFVILKDNELVRQPKGTIISPNPIKPEPLNKWESLSKKDDYVGIAAQAIYGETFEITGQKSTGIMDIINKATEQENRFSFALFAADQSPLAAKLSGLWFTDRNVKKGESYLYKVYLAGPAPFKVDTGYVYTSVDEFKELPKPINLHAAFTDKMALLTWTKPGMDRYYNGFFIEKSSDNGNTFKAVNTKPFVNPEQQKADRYPYYFFIDSLHENNINYMYRIYGISPFGEKGPMSDTVSGKGMDKVKDNPHIINKEIIKDKVVKLTWEFPAERIKTISGFRILRSDNDNSGYKVISSNINANNRTYTDSLPLTVNYYKVLAFKEGGMASISLAVMVQMPDSIPPAPPVGLIALADTSGKVVLKWKANKEPDIYGYRVYRANGKVEEFSQLTIAPIRDTVFSDKVVLKTLSKNIFYQVLAVDKRQNYSAFSEICQVKRPDIIPPVSPVITNIESTKTGITLNWVNSSSEDVIKHTIYRQLDGTNKNEKLFEFKDSLTSFIDSTAKAQLLYRYTITATDESGLQSTPTKAVAMTRVTNSKDVFGDIKYKVDRDKNTIELYWNAIENVNKYIIYRATNDQPLSQFANISADISKFMDVRTIQNTTYKYGIKAIYKNGTQTPLSNIIEVKF